MGEGVSELRINYGPGYRVYYKKHGREVVILLAGGDKHAQTNDIKTALCLARNLLKLIMTKTITTRYDVADTFAPQKKWLLILKLALRKQVGM